MTADLIARLQGPNYTDAVDEAVVEIVTLRQQLAAAEADAARLRGALREAERRLWQHHEAGYHATLGEHCRVCWPDMNDDGSNIFLTIAAALKGESHEQPD